MTSMPHALMTLIYGLHVVGGMAALVSGTVAVCARKGGRLHRAAGQIFVVSMLVMAVFADTLAVVIPDQLVNVVIGTLAGYLVLTSWLTVRGRTRGSGAADWIAAPRAADVLPAAIRPSWRAGFLDGPGVGYRVARAGMARAARSRA